MHLHPLLITYTGNGKGKTTAALGILFRSLGYNKKCAVIQFIKSDDLVTGERKLAQQLDVLWENHGVGFTWKNDKASNIAASVEGFERFKALIASGEYDLIILDEFTYPLSLGFLDEKEVISYFEKIKKDANRPHIVITGRAASPSLLEMSDLVSEIVEVKTPYEEEYRAPNDD